jgi:hypothetical protein
MNGVLETMAFVLVIAGQFLAAIVLISKRKAIYADPEARVSSEDPAEACSESPAHDGEEHQPRPA